MTHEIVKDFTDLVAWKLARELRKKTYDLSNRFLAEERYVLTPQFRESSFQ